MQAKHYELAEILLETFGKSGALFYCEAIIDMNIGGESNMKLVKAAVLDLTETKVIEHTPVIADADQFCADIYKSLTSPCVVDRVIMRPRPESMRN